MRGLSVFTLIIVAREAAAGYGAAPPFQEELDPPVTSGAGCSARPGQGGPVFSRGR
jgi:hypothetical protein